jgi:RNA polymerase sigma-70 factor (ECF subfamily)
MALKQGNGLQGWEIAVTKKLIGEFRRRSRSLYREEFDDLLQECLMHWLEVRQQLVPDRDGPPIAYMARVVRNKLIDLARERETDKRRGDQETVSLDDTAGDSEDAPTYADLVDAEQGRDLGGQESFDPADIRIDVTEVMRRLTPEQRRQCDLLGAQSLSIKEAAEKLRIPRATLYEEIKRIRKIFALHGLDDYLQP